MNAIPQPPLNGVHGVSFQTGITIMLIAVTVFCTVVTLKALDAVQATVSSNTSVRASQHDVEHHDHMSIVDSIDGMSWAFANCPANPDCRFIGKPKAIIKLSQQADAEEVMRGTLPAHERPMRQYRSQGGR